jgi:hypothetical protein
MCDERESYPDLTICLIKPLLKLMVMSIDTTVCTGQPNIHV